MPRPATNSTRINFYIPDKVHSALRIIANRRATSVSELIRNACQTYAVQEAKKIKEGEYDLSA